MCFDFNPVLNNKRNKLERLICCCRCLSQSPACFPALTFFHGRGERPSGLLLRGDSEGRLVVWQVPEVTERQMTLVRQESFDRLPALMPKLCTTLQDLWNTHDCFSPGVLDGLVGGEGKRSS